MATRNVTALKQFHAAMLALTSAAETMGMQANNPYLDVVRNATPNVDALQPATPIISDDELGELMEMIEKAQTDDAAYAQVMRFVADLGAALRAGVEVAKAMPL